MNQILPADTAHLASAYPPGKHVLLDFWGAEGLADVERVRAALTGAAAACRATVLDVRLHQFGDEAGITGVALLAESHISIHTWPETGYAALDVFVCGNCDPEGAVRHLNECFRPARTRITSHLRGEM